MHSQQYNSEQIAENPKQMPTGQNIMNIGLSNGIRATNTSMEMRDYDKHSNDDRGFFNSESMNTQSQVSHNTTGTKVHGVHEGQVAKV